MPRDAVPPPPPAAATRMRPLALPVGLLAIVACNGGGDTPPDHTAPALTAIAHAAPTTLRLSFSEAVVVGQADPAAFRLSLAVKDAQSTVYYALEYAGLEEDTDGPISDGDPSAASASAGTSDSAGTDGGSADGGSSDGGSTYGGTYDPTSDPTDPTADPTYDPSADGGGYAIPSAPDRFTRSIPTLAIDDVSITGVHVAADDPTVVELTLAAPLGDSIACEVLQDFTADGTKAGIFLHHRQGSGSPRDAAGNAMADLAAHWVVASSRDYVELQGDFPTMDPYLPIPCG